ncbi:helicase-related protein [Dietzia maris]|uniref:Helicase-related protein n=1 Tax=Dietzia maris TaxID=37915 RepID=A0AAE4U6E4_9ACTN|nr:helicase-related protein [Dietzia maris]MDV6298138.1 helicase-related protein [Dietzia maris]
MNDHVSAFDDLQRGVVVEGLASGPVTIVTCDEQGPGCVQVFYQDQDAQAGVVILFESDLDQLRLAPDKARWTFDADATEFKLAAEAMRIQRAGLFDPMLAVSSSNVDPLPHQIRAVYEEMLPRTELRFLLADDPGAGKTIMAGLYLKEMQLRGDVERALIVAPGGLVEQWQEELHSKFGIEATIFAPDVSLPGANPFADARVLIARMDQLARNEVLHEWLEQSRWDLVVVDEAHRMSAKWYGLELDPTRRYRLGQTLSETTRHLLLMTATPHSGDPGSYRAFLALVDPDTFAGPQPPNAPTPDASAHMRRMVKEDLLRFDGTPLFPERIAETVPYELTAAEQELYEEVTRYVREEMNRADALDDTRKRTVGFALTVLQRRLASSTHAIVRSLERRRDRLQARLKEEQARPFAVPSVVPSSIVEGDEWDDDDIAAAELEAAEDVVVDAASAARTAAEMRVEIGELDRLVALARSVRDAGEDRKWAQLRTILSDEVLTAPVVDPAAGPRKLIIFTEHRDTLTYLEQQISSLFGQAEAVVTIHGGTPREERLRVREEFTHNPGCRILLATDAAGEGLNLQAAHLMVNYDLPWNPNRIEQRFGRVHRIGQRQVCRLWNLVADQTREGQVFQRLLTKMEEQRKAYGGRLFDVLGEAFRERPLRELLMEAIRYGDLPEHQERLDQVIDAEVADGLEELLAERRLADDGFGSEELHAMRRTMEEARARRLQPHNVEAFFVHAFAAAGGRIVPRERGRYEIRNVPAPLRHRVGQRPVATKYQRVTFDPADTGRVGPAELLAPGHPLMDVVLEHTIETYRGALQRGTVLAETGRLTGGPRLMLAATSTVSDGSGNAVSKRFEFVTVDAHGLIDAGGVAPYLDAEPLPGVAGPDGDPRVTELLEAPWLRGGTVDQLTRWASAHLLPEHLAAVRLRVEPRVAKAKREVRDRMTETINFLDFKATDLEESPGRGRASKRRTPERLRADMEELIARRDARLTELDSQSVVRAESVTVDGAALLVPADWVCPVVPAHARETEETDRRAVAAVMAAERKLGRMPVEQAHNNEGYDILSEGTDGRGVFIEVKGRIAGADTFFFSKSQVLCGKNMEAQYRLALVSVSPDNAAHDEVRYLVDPCRGMTFGDFAASGVEGDWKAMWAKGGAPV